MKCVALIGALLFTAPSLFPQTSASTSSARPASQPAVRAYLALSDALPKQYPFADAARKQVAELRDAADRMDADFQALLDYKDEQARNPDRDNLKRYAEDNARVGAPSSKTPRVVFLVD